MKNKEKLEDGVKFDQKKPRWDLLPWEEIDDIVRVLTFGSEKYEDDNWKKVEDASRRYLAAAMRHIKADVAGEFFDKETGLPHLAHAGCCLLFKSWIDKQSIEQDGEQLELPFDDTSDLSQAMALGYADEDEVIYAEKSAQKKKPLPPKTGQEF